MKLSFCIECGLMRQPHWLCPVACFTTGEMQKKGSNSFSTSANNKRGSGKIPLLGPFSLGLIHGTGASS